MDDRGIDILGTKALARAIEHASTKSVDGIAAFFGAICMPAAEEFGLMLRDRIAKYRQNNLANIAEKTKAVIEHVEISPSGNCNPRLIHEVIEHASWADDGCIQQMWAGLIAAASSTSPAADDSLVYTETLQRLTPFQARLLNHVYGDPRCCSVNPGSLAGDEYYSPKYSLLYPARDVLEVYPDDLSKFVNIANVSHQDILDDDSNHGIAVGRFRPQINALVTLGLFRHAQLVNGGTEGVQFLPTLKGLDLYMRGLGYKIYPLEAFILTQQHWCQLKGIDPMNISANRVR